MKKLIATAIAALTATLLLCFSAGAFDNNDYGGGDYGGNDYGGNDYGGSDYSSSSDSDPLTTIIGIGVVVLRRLKKEIHGRGSYTSFFTERC